MRRSPDRYIGLWPRLPTSPPPLCPLASPCRSPVAAHQALRGVRKLSAALPARGVDRGVDRRQDPHLQAMLGHPPALRAGGLAARQLAGRCAPCRAGMPDLTHALLTARADPAAASSPSNLASVRQDEGQCGMLQAMPRQGSRGAQHARAPSKALFTPRCSPLVSLDVWSHG